MPQRKPRAILGVAADATEDEIRTAFRKAAKKYHPDKQSNPEDKEQANQKFSEINEAYESLMSQFHQNSNYEGMEGEQDLNEAPPPSRTRPKDTGGGRKVRKRSGATDPTKPSSFRGVNGNNSQNSENSPTGRKEGFKSHRRGNSVTNSPGVNSQAKRSIRSPGIISPGAPRSPGNMAGRKSVRDNLKSPVTVTGRPRPKIAQRNSSAPQRNASAPTKSGPSHNGHRRSKSSLTSPAPPARPPLETSSPTVTRKKLSPMNSPNSPRSPRKPSSLRSGGGGGGHNRPSIRNNLGDASLSPHRLKNAGNNRKGHHTRHSSAGALNYHNNQPPPAPPMMGSSPKMTRPSSQGNLRQSIRRSKAPPPPSAMQRLSMKLTNRSELKAEKKARAEKLMA